MRLEGFLSLLSCIVLLIVLIVGLRAAHEYFDHCWPKAEESRPS